MRLQGLRVRSGVLLVFVAVGVLGFSASAFAETVTFEPGESGHESFTVPAGVTQVEVTAVGGAGATGSNEGAPEGGARGGFGALVHAVLPVNVIHTLYVRFSGAGAGGEGPGGGTGGAGGDASDVGTNPVNLSSRLIVAGGGGGGGAGSGMLQGLEKVGNYGGAGGDAGFGLPGEPAALVNGAAKVITAGGGRAGSLSSGGAGGTGECTATGFEGGLGQGGNGASHFCPAEGIVVGGGGGGGGGYFGGGGGGGAIAGGGGGSGASFIDEEVGASGSVGSGDGVPQEVMITYTPPKAICTSNIGTITLSPGLTGTAVYQGVKIKGSLTGCSGEPFTEAKYTATSTTTSKVTCSALSGPGAASFGSVKYVWTPKTKATTGTFSLPLTETAGIALSSELESGPYSPLTLSGTASETYTNAAICGVPQGSKGIVKAVTKGTFSESAVGFS
jgi:hypothetical protein